MAPVRYHEERFPPKALDWPRLARLIGPASAAVARFEGILHAIPNADVLLSPLTTQEAVLSSRIEGTQATFGEVLEYEAGATDAKSPEKTADIQEVLNYRRAMTHAVKMREKVPLSQRMVKEAHKVLMTGVRGENKTPGEYRRVANWIGPPGSKVEEARFIPPDAHKVAEAMSSWEKYIHAPAIDPLVQLAILHAEFESVHPFLDGNGRLGRLIVPLFLVEKKLLSSPNFYISDFLERHRDEYYDRLLAVSRDDDWSGWCEFFLTAVLKQGEANDARAKAILSLYKERKDWITEVTRSQHAIRALDWFFSRPVFRTTDFVEAAGIPRPTANRILVLVKERKLLRELRPGSGRRAAVLAFPELVNIAEGRSVL
ncbi:MAG TPA: Fic/DOC family N-terminal domain-containing protein [Phycisphaerales bacterium]|nr:Fic/DOC family N-terminal domain-containing protein [Phycisphaerales bacterium]